MKRDQVRRKAQATSIIFFLQLSTDCQCIQSPNLGPAAGILSSDHSQLLGKNLPIPFVCGRLYSDETTPMEGSTFRMQGYAASSAPLALHSDLCTKRDPKSDHTTPVGSRYLTLCFFEINDRFPTTVNFFVISGIQGIFQTDRTYRTNQR